MLRLGADWPTFGFGPVVWTRLADVPDDPTPLRAPREPGRLRRLWERLPHPIREYRETERIRARYVAEANLLRDSRRQSEALDLKRRASEPKPERPNNNASFYEVYREIKDRALKGDPRDIQAAEAMRRMHGFD